MALRCAGSVSASCCFAPRHDHTPSLTRLGHGANVCPRAPSAIRSAAYPSTTSRPPTVKLRTPPPTATTTARWSPAEISCCSPLGGIVCSVTNPIVASAPASVQGGVERAHGDGRQRPALPAKNGAPQLLRLREEGVVGQRVDEVPCPLRDLLLELPRPPAGIAGEHPQRPQRRGEQRRVVVEIDGDD